MPFVSKKRKLFFVIKLVLERESIRKISHYIVIVKNFPLYPLPSPIFCVTIFFDIKIKQQGGKTMDKYSDMLADILFSIERISNTLRVVAGKEPNFCRFSYNSLPTIEQSLDVMSNFIDDINESIVDIFTKED